MTIVRYNPWQEMTAMQRQLNRLMDDTLATTNSSNLNHAAKAPAAELIETEEALHLKLEVAGMQPEDLDIQVTVKSVAISGDRKADATPEKAKVRSEFSYGKFSRTIALPVKIQNTKVTAEFKNGILNLTLPKAEAEINKVVKLNLGEVKA